MEALAAEKVALKNKIKEAKSRGDAAEVIQPMYDRYTAIKAEMDALSSGGGKGVDFSAGQGDGAPAFEDGTRSLGAGGEAYTLEELMGEKARLKDAVKVAKESGSPPELIQPIYDEYTAVKTAIAEWDPQNPPLKPQTGGNGGEGGVEGGVVDEVVEEEDEVVVVAGVGSGDGEEDGGDGEESGGEESGGVDGGGDGGDGGEGASTGASVAGAAASASAASASAAAAATSASTSAASASTAAAAAEAGPVELELEVTEGELEVEVIKRFGGFALKRRYVVVEGLGGEGGGGNEDAELVVYKTAEKEKEKMRIRLLGVHLRPVVGEANGEPTSGFEILQGRCLAKGIVFMSETKDGAKAWFRTLWKLIKSIENEYRGQLFVPRAPDGFNGKVLHMEWMEILTKGKWEWRYFVLADFVLAYYDVFPDSNEDLTIPESVLNPTSSRSPSSSPYAFPFVGSLLKESPTTDHTRKHVFTMKSPHGVIIPIAAYSEQRHKQWVAGLQITARKALTTLLDNDEEITFPGVYVMDGNKTVDVSLVVLSMSRVGMRKASPAGSGGGGGAPSASPLFHMDLELEIEDAQELLWEHSFSSLKEFRRDSSEVRLDFVERKRSKSGSGGSSSPKTLSYVFRTPATHAVSNLLSTLLVEVAKRAKSKKRGGKGRKKRAQR